MELYPFDNKRALSSLSTEDLFVGCLNGHNSPSVISRTMLEIDRMKMVRCVAP